MASYRWQEKEYPQIPYDEWTSGELSNVEHAFGKALDGSSTGDIAAAMFVVAVLRVEADKNVVALADVARALPMKELAIVPDEEEASPLVEPETNGHDAQQTSGIPVSVSSE